MKEYLLNCGTFNIIVIPEVRSYYLLGDDAHALTSSFVAGAPVAYERLEPHWFQYSGTETWTGLDGKEHHFDESFGEGDLIDHFVLKKFNSGSLVAVREMPAGKVQLFKPDKVAVV